MPYTDDITAYHCLVGGPFHIDETCPVGRQIPPELRAAGRGEGLLCATCELRLEARERPRIVNGG